MNDDTTDGCDDSCLNYLSIWLPIKEIAGELKLAKIAKMCLFNDFSLITNLPWDWESLHYYDFALPVN